MEKLARWEFGFWEWEKMLIWWTTYIDCVLIGEDLPEDFPEYLKKEYISRYGRNGRGRLWTSESFGDIKVEIWKENPLTNMIGLYYGGIVIRDCDNESLKDMPGITTDLSLNRV